MAIFDTLAQIQIGSRSGTQILPPPAFEEPTPFQGIISGLTFNGMMILDLAAERDERITTAGEVSLVPELPKRFNPSNIDSLLGNDSRTRTPDSHYFRLHDLHDELILSKERLQFCWADHQCRSTASSPDDLITSFLTDSIPSSGYTTPSNAPASNVVCEEEDDEDCSEGSGDAGSDDDDEEPVVVTAKVNSGVIFDERSTTTHKTEVFELPPTTSSSTTTSTTEAPTTRRLPKTTPYIDPKDLEQSYRPRSTSSYPSYPKTRPEINEVPKPSMKKPGFYGAASDKVPSGKDKGNQHHVSKTFNTVDRTALTIGIIATIIIVIVFVAPILLFAKLRMMDPSAIPSSHVTGQLMFSQSGLGSSLQGCKTMGHFGPPALLSDGSLFDHSAVLPVAGHPQSHNQLRHHLQQHSGPVVPIPGPTSILKKKKDPSLEWYV